MRRFCILFALLCLCVMLASCINLQPQGGDVTLPALVITTPADTTNETTPQIPLTETTPEVTTPDETTPIETPEETTPAVTEPDFENNPDPDGTKRY